MQLIDVIQKFIDISLHTTRFYYLKQSYVDWQKFKYVEYYNTIIKLNLIIKQNPKKSVETYV